MFIYKRRFSFLSFIFELNEINLYNLKNPNEVSVVPRRGMRVKSVPRKVTQKASQKRKMSDGNSMRSNNSEHWHVNCFDHNVGIGVHSGSSGTPKASHGISTNQQSIDLHSKVRGLNHIVSSDLKYSGRTDVEAKAFKRTHSSYSNLTQIKQPHNFVEMQQALHLSNLRQCVNPANYQTSPYVLYRSFSDCATSYEKVNNVCLNSEQHHVTNAGTVSSRSNRAASAPRHSKVLRAWKQSSLGRILDKKKGGGSRPGTMFKIMSYNVLAQDLLEEHLRLYKDNEPKALQWKHRWQLLFWEIKEHNCDIVCLQEVQFEHIEHFYSLLKTLGYESIYKKRTGFRIDGCAIYYKKDSFHLVEHIDVEYNQPNITLLNRDNVGLIAKFAPKHNLSAEFVVATTHLLYNPKRHDVRLAQMQVFLTEIGRIAHMAQGSTSTEYAPVIITGDLNSAPDSHLYQLICNGRLKYEDVTVSKSCGTYGRALLPSYLRITDSCQHAELLRHRQSTTTKLSRTEELKLIKLRNSRQTVVVLEETIHSYESHFSTGTLSHPLKLTSVYKHVVDDDNEATTYQNHWLTVDYIFYSGIRDETHKFRDDKLKLLSYYTLPTTRDLGNVKIPNLQLGSDHLALLAKFKLEY